MHALLDLIHQRGFNAIRVPLAVTSTLSDPPASMFGGGVSEKNPEVHNLSYLAVLDVLIAQAARRDLLILLDMHRLSAGDRNNPLWQDGSVPEAHLIGAWQRLAQRHCHSSWNVMGADVFNEPWAASWGFGGASEDWAAAAERLAAAVSSACPRWLIFVEGVSHTTAAGVPAAAGQSELGHNWASNLEGVRTRPLSLAHHPHKLVLSPHIYGPSVAPQPYFADARFPANLPPIWETHFGFVTSEAKGCVVVGEWGGWFTGSDAAWQKAFGAYLAQKGIGSFYWALNPTSRDTGGLVLSDWTTPNELKLALLDSMPVTPIVAGVAQASAAGGERHKGPHEPHEYEKHAAAHGKI